MREMESIKRVGDEFSNVTTGSLTIATTHTQARYKLPAAVKAFIQMHPEIKPVSYTHLDVYKRQTLDALT